MERKTESIFKVIHYRPRKTCRKDKLLYPTFKVGGDTAIYYQSFDEVERNMQSLANCFRDKDDSFIDTYAYVVLELPLGLEVNDSHFFLLEYTSLMVLCGERINMLISFHCPSLIQTNTITGEREISFGGEHLKKLSSGLATSWRFLATQEITIGVMTM